MNTKCECGHVQVFHQPGCNRKGCKCQKYALHSHEPATAKHADPTLVPLSPAYPTYPTYQACEWCLTFAEAQKAPPGTPLPGCKCGHLMYQWHRAKGIGPLVEHSHECLKQGCSCAKFERVDKLQGCQYHGAECMAAQQSTTVALTGYTTTANVTLGTTPLTFSSGSAQAIYDAAVKVDDWGSSHSTVVEGIYDPTPEQVEAEAKYGVDAPRCECGHFRAVHPTPYKCNGTISMSTCKCMLYKRFEGVAAKTPMPTCKCGHQRISHNNDGSGWCFVTPCPCNAYEPETCSEPLPQPGDFVREPDIPGVTVEAIKRTPRRRHEPPAAPVVTRYVLTRRRSSKWWLDVNAYGTIVAASREARGLVARFRLPDPVGVKISIWLWSAAGRDVVFAPEREAPAPLPGEHAPLKLNRRSRKR